MKRTTIFLSDELVALIDRERHRRGVPASVIVREALDGYFGRAAAPAAIVDVGCAGGHTARNAESILAREWTYERLMGVAAPDAPREADRNDDRSAARPSTIQQSKAS